MPRSTFIAADHPGRDALKGDWKQTKLVMNGRSRAADGTTVTIDDDAVTVRHGDESEPPAPYTLDPAKKAIDLKLENEGRTMRGIYKVEGKTLTICLHPESRPETFEANPGSGNLLMVFERP